MNQARSVLSGRLEHKDLICAKSGRFVMEAVRTEDGTLYDAKTAKLHGIPAIECSATTHRARTILDDHMPSVPIATNLSKWRDIFTVTDNLLFYTSSDQAAPTAQNSTELS